ncbi:MAG: tetratricopeptide repeat protein, partial [Fibrobacter sp.]|nr:tetratricopeptide repeat protein [Fibrobacter sp.]
CMSGDTVRSLEHVTVALGKAPTDSRIKFWAGKVYLHINKIQTARQLFNDALAINPSYAECYEALGDSYLKETKFKDASRYYFSAWEKGGYNELRAFKLGNSLSYDKKFLEAKDFYEAIVNRNPGYSEVVYKLVFAYCELGDLNKAKKTLELFTANNPQWAQLAQAKIYETEKNTSAALDALRLA